MADLGGSSQSEDLFSGFEGAAPLAAPTNTTQSILNLFGGSNTSTNITPALAPPSLVSYNIIIIHCS